MTRDVATPKCARASLTNAWHSGLAVVGGKSLAMMTAGGTTRSCDSLGTSIVSRDREQPQIAENNTITASNSLILGRSASRRAPGSFSQSFRRPRGGKAGSRSCRPWQRGEEGGGLRWKRSASAGLGHFRSFAARAGCLRTCRSRQSRYARPRRGNGRCVRFPATLRTASGAVRQVLIASDIRSRGAPSPRRVPPSFHPKASLNSAARRCASTPLWPSHIQMMRAPDRRYAVRHGASLDKC